MRVGVRDVVRQRSDRGRPRGNARFVSSCEGGRISTGDQSRRGRLDVSLDARDLSGKQQVRSLPHLPRLSQHAGAVDIRVAMHYPEADELGLLESGNQLQHSRLLTPLQLRLKAHETEMVT